MNAVQQGMMSWGDRMLTFTGKPRADMYRHLADSLIQVDSYSFLFSVEPGWSKEMMSLEALVSGLTMVAAASIFRYVTCLPFLCK